MALAVLEFQHAGGDTVRFRADIGHNRYFRYQIGDAETQDGGGIAMLANTHHRSELFGPLRPSSLGRTDIEIPLGLFGRDVRFVQLTSFRDLPNQGVAISEIVEVPFGVVPLGLPRDQDRRPREEDGSTLPRRPRHGEKGQNALDMQVETNRIARAPGRVPGRPSVQELSAAPASVPGRSTGDMPYAAPFSYREARYSDAMFLEALGPLLTSALPIVTQVIGGLGGPGGIANILGGLFGSGVRPAAPVANPSGANPQSITPDLARQIAELIHVVSALQQATPSPSATAVTQQPADTRHSQTLSNSGYSQQMLDPITLLGVLPALAPLLEKVLNPQTIDAILSNLGPKATIGAVTDAVKDIGGMTIQAHQNIMDQFRKSMPSSDTTPLLNHLLAITQSLSEPTILPSYRRIESVQIHFAPQTTAMLQGRERLVYRTGAPGGLAFPLTIETPRPIRKARLYLIVKVAETLRVVAEKEWDVTNVATGPLSETPRLAASESGGLLPGVEYLICTYLVWQTKQGERIGVSRTQSVHIMGEYAYQGIEAGGEIVALNDVDKFRPYWHKVWQESFTREKRRWEWDCKYYYALHSDGGRSEHMETVTEETLGNGRRVEGRLKSGLRLSLSDLNALLPRVSSYQSLNAAQLEALSSPAFVAAFGRAARSKAQFRGSEGNSVALWIYPEMRIQPVVLLRASAPDASGLVRELSEEIVHFPVPALAHFIGVSTETNPFLAPDHSTEEQSYGR